MEASNSKDGSGAVRRAIDRKPACVNVKTKGVISPIVAATSDKRDKASIEYNASVHMY